MRISLRIHKLADMVGQGESVCDIGTDHGYVPMILVKNNISPRVILTDISEGSLSKAICTFETAGLRTDPDDFRLGYGLRPVGYSEVDTAIIAGLGGHTISDILKDDTEKSKSFKRLILQPRKHSGHLRYFLYVNGWDISDDILVSEGKFECEILSCYPSRYKERRSPYEADDIRWVYPREMVISSPEEAGRRIEWKIESIREQLRNLRSSESDQSDRIQRLYEDLMYLRDMKGD